jgi:hypothetical protein
MRTICGLTQMVSWNVYLKETGKLLAWIVLGLVVLSNAVGI